MLMNTLFSHQYNLGKAYVVAMFCSFTGHQNNPPLIESFEDRRGKTRSVYLCRRCFKKM